MTDLSFIVEPGYEMVRAEAIRPAFSGEQSLRGEMYLAIRCIFSSHREREVSRRSNSPLPGAAPVDC